MDQNKPLQQPSPGVTFEIAFDQLSRWCVEKDFAGHDPFDALNSRVFQQTPLSRSRNARLLWTQFVKRSPFDVRSLARVPVERNAKGIALFALSQIAVHRRLQDQESAAAAKYLLSILLELKLDYRHGVAWGYNFDWQSRNFLASKKEATIVPTAFAARALVEAARVFPEGDVYLTTARSVCDFIIHDLFRPVDTDEEVCFSYTTNSDTRIFNASLLAAEVLATVGSLTHEPQLLELASKAARYVVNRQLTNGGWTYGTGSNQDWIDNFHTAYLLFSLKRINDTEGLGQDFGESLRKGYDFWVSNFFLADGWPKYYDDNPYPADIHAGASAIVTFLEFKSFADSITHAERVATWTIDNLRDRRGYFYYQRRRFYTVRKPYMRWGQAWMMYGLARLLEETAS